jgi:hypothetical protein
MLMTVVGASSRMGWLPLGVLALMLGGCPGSLANPERFVGGNIQKDGSDEADEPMGCDPVMEIFSKSPGESGCGTLACHGEGTTIDLVTGDVFARLTTTATASSTGDCMDLNILTSGDAENSTLVRRVSGTTCGGQMPVGGALTDAQVDCIQQWITDQSN